MSNLGAIVRPVSSLLLSAPMVLFEATTTDASPPIAGLMSEMAEIVAQTRDLEQSARAWSDVLVADRSGDRSTDVEQDIEELLRLERQIGAHRDRFGAIAKRFVTARPAGALGRAAVEDVAARIDDILVTCMETLRDTRWALIAADAARQPSQPGTSLSTPEEVDAWFAEIEAPEA